MSLALVIWLGAAASTPDMHPLIPLLDPDGAPVDVSGGPISTLKSCGSCHDAPWIAEHSAHADLGASRPYLEGSAPRPWDTHAGPYGRWDPSVYDVLTGTGTAALGAWAQRLGGRHVGGGPFSPLGEEMNCLSCHARTANEPARRRALAEGRLAWLATATLEGGPIVTATVGGWAYDPEAFDDHRVPAGLLGLESRRSEACGQCHGTVKTDAEDGLVLEVDDFDAPDPKLGAGLVYAPSPMHRSGVNLAGKPELTRAWDIHAERLLECTSCHANLNAPSGSSRPDGDAPEHLAFDARSERLGDYLKRPRHDFATGYGGALGEPFAGSMRRCADCHEATETHDWLPNAALHFDALDCESCHVPAIYAPLLESIDWTVLTEDGQPVLSHRGTQGRVGQPSTLIEGTTPALLTRTVPSEKLSPYNLVTTFSWVEGEPPRPVSRDTLERAYFEGGDGYAKAVVSKLDADGDGGLEGAELRLDTPEKIAWMKARLQSLGARAPRLWGEIQPVGLHHQVTGRNFATRTCTACHEEDGLPARAMRLSPSGPAGVKLGFVADARVAAHGEIREAADGSWSYHPNPYASGTDLLGSRAWPWVDTLGLMVFALVLVAATAHGALRVWSDHGKGA